MDPPKPTPEQEFRRKTITDGAWTPVPVSELDEMLRDLVKRGEEFPEWAARLDLRYWADKGDVKPVSYYQKRWKWKGRQRTYDLLKEFGLKGQDRGKTRERNENDSRTEKERFENDNLGESPRNDKVENDSRTKKERNENESRTVYPEAYSDGEEENEYAREQGEISEEFGRVLTAWRQWHGESVSPAIRATIIQLLRPAGSGIGARLSDDPTTDHNGFTPEQVIAGVEAMAKRNHHSPDALVRHVAGLMPAAGGTHGKADRGDAGRAAGRTDYQQGREVGRNPVDVSSYVEFSDTFLAGVDEEIERRRGRSPTDPGRDDPGGDADP